MSSSPAPSHEPSSPAQVAAPVAAALVPPVELTRRAVVAGVVFGAMFGAANAYLGLRVGMTVATSIPVAVMTVALFRGLGGQASILEANLAQTIGSASTALATGSIFTLPALFLWGIVPAYWQISGLALLGGLLGIAAMIPLRQLLLVRSAKELPYPEGRACAEVLNATTGESASTSSGAWIFRGLLLGVGVKLALELLRLMPGELSLELPGLRNAELAMEIAPALIAVGYILGFRQSAIVVSGSVISSLVLIPLISHVGGALQVPLAPETTKLVSQMDAGGIWSRYVRYIGAGAVAAAGIATVVKALPSMAGAFLAVASGLKGSRGAAGGAAGDEARGRTERDISGTVVVAVLALVVGALVLVPGLLGDELSLGQRLVCALGVGVLGVAFVAVASRIVGLVGVSSQPTSGITLVTLLSIGGVFTLMGWTGPGMKAAVLMVGTVVAIAASKAGDISQDLKTGQLVGATPAVQQVGQFIGAATACWAVAATLLFLGRAYGFGSQELPAPQATLMKTFIEGLMSGSLPRDLVLSGAGLAVGAMLMGVNGLGFAIGVYLPLAAMAPIFVGGVARRIADGWSRKAEEDAEGGPGVLAASGLVAGEGLAGLAVAVLVGGFGYARPKVPVLEGGAGSLAALVLVVGLCAFLVRAGSSRR
jgi:putative OPT family oligopeptide transporter